jgi:hypothetical protein
MEEELVVQRQQRLGFSGRPREPTSYDRCRKGTTCCWNTHVFAGSLPSLSFADTGLLKMQIQQIAGDSLKSREIVCCKGGGAPPPT